MHGYVHIEAGVTSYPVPNPVGLSPPQCVRCCHTPRPAGSSLRLDQVISNTCFAFPAQCGWVTIFTTESNAARVTGNWGQHTLGSLLVTLSQVVNFPPALYEYVTAELGLALVLVLNKVDLAPPALVVAWKHYFHQHYPQLHIVLFTSFPRDTRTQQEPGSGE